MSRWRRRSTVPAFEAVDVHMTDLVAGRASLAGFKGLRRRGFSYGDVLARAAAGQHDSCSTPGSEPSSSNSSRAAIRSRSAPERLQMMAALKELIPGREHWPAFVRNRSEQFRSAPVMVEITPSPSLFFDGMPGAACHRDRPWRRPREFPEISF